MKKFQKLLLAVMVIVSAVAVQSETVWGKVNNVSKGGTL
jgi:hypothetical protein